MVDETRFKRDIKTIPRNKRVGALPDSIAGAATKSRLGGQSAEEIEEEVIQIKED